MLPQMQNSGNSMVPVQSGQGVVIYGCLSAAWHQRPMGAKGCLVLVPDNILVHPERG